ncbi:PilN domain-containing protein [Candidatus Aerophobetes bacterium]|nr:PilN domain-containing protein [Candidatus Aerophobetes bacterium]
MLQINLLPREILKKREKRDFIIFVGICGIVSVLICSLYFLSLIPEVTRVKRKLKLVQSQIKEYQPVLEQIKKINQKNDQLQLCLNSLRTVAIKQFSWPRILYEISKALPENVWLREIKKDRNTPFIEVKGSSLTQTLGVAKFIGNLNHSSLFEEVNFTNSSKREIMGKIIMDFDLKCKLSEPVH